MTTKPTKSKKTAISKSRAPKSDIKKATQKAIAQYGNALKNLANR